MAGGTTKTSDNIFEDNGIKVLDSLCAAPPSRTLQNLAMGNIEGLVEKVTEMGLEEKEELIKRLKQGHGDFNSWTKLDGILAGCAELLNTYNSE
ncbi:hypothetical protein niasHT_031356 [Heterodera trifolii]|uniref:Uncharacterized protein n=1 Tax=Heterodera trifolii TaxID=157864 RepID=A0ABD2IYC0_9BILA